MSLCEKYLAWTYSLIMFQRTVRSRMSRTNSCAITFESYISLELHDGARQGSSRAPTLSPSSSFWPTSGSIAVPQPMPHFDIPLTESLCTLPILKFGTIITGHETHNIDEVIERENTRIRFLAPPLPTRMSAFCKCYIELSKKLSTM